MNVPLTVVVVIAAALLSFVGSLIILNLQSIKNCLRKQDKQVEKTNNDMKNLGNDFQKCKVDCERSFVNTEVFLRETGFARRALEGLTASVNRLDGKLTVVEKLPQICGDISRNIVKEMKNGDS